MIVLIQFTRQRPRVSSVFRSILYLLLLLVGAVDVYGGSSAYYSSDTIAQSFEVYPKDGRYHVRGRIDLEEQFSSDRAGEAIRYALDGLPRSGEVYLHAGTYELSDPIVVPSYATLTGSGTGTVLQIAESHSTGTALTSTDGTRVTISDLTIRSNNAAGKKGIELDHCGDCRVEDVLIVGMQEYGIHLKNNSFLCEIRGARVADSGKSGIYLQDLARGGRGGDYVPNLVTNSIVYGGNKGIECNKALVINLVGCQVYQTEGPAYHLYNGSNSVLLSGCRTYQISNDAVVIEGSHEVNLTGNIFCWHTGHGLVLRNVMWGTVTGNNIIDSGSINLYDSRDSLVVTGERPFTKLPEEGRPIPTFSGIVIESESKGLTINGNAIFNWPVAPPMEYGITEDSTCFKNVITANNINFCEKADVASAGKETSVSDNVSYLPQPYYGKPSRRFQVYDTRLLDLFIEDLGAF